MEKLTMLPSLLIIHFDQNATQTKEAFRLQSFSFVIRQMEQKMKREKHTLKKNPELPIA